MKVDLTKAQKAAIGRPSSPRWEIDLVAYKGSTNELLAVECKSYFDSRGVLYRNGRFEPAERYKLFSEPDLRAVVLRKLADEMVDRGACAANPRVVLCLAVGKMAGSCDRAGLNTLFSANDWKLFDASWMRDCLKQTATDGYENDVVYVVSKILGRGGRDEADPVDSEE